VTWTDPTGDAFAIREPLSQVLASLLTVAVAAGLIRMLLNIGRPVNRFLLAWAALPLGMLMMLVAAKPDFRVAVYYLTLAVPVAYVAGGYGTTWALSLIRARGMIGGVALCATIAILSAWNASAAADTAFRRPFIQPGFMPLRWARELGSLWQRECATINGSNHWWELSLIESARRWKAGGVHLGDASSIWTFAPEGGGCALQSSGLPLPHAEPLLLRLGGEPVRTQRALPYAAPPGIQTSVNLGWSLLEFSAPEHARAGETLTVQHAWRVDSLPSEPYSSWYFAPFIKLIAPDGRIAAEVDNAVALQGWEWRRGEIQVSEVALRLPADLAPGVYRVVSSLFDPNQKKNAVYFGVGGDSSPTLTLERTLRILPTEP
jgi:hypothetical protein